MSIEKNLQKCSNCTHAARMNKYINTVPSIFMCLNEEADAYLEPQAWSCICKCWQLMPDEYFD